MMVVCAPAVAHAMSPLRNLTFLFILPKATVVTIEIYDADGNKVATPIAERRYEAGEHKEEIDLSSFIAGSYMIRITTPERTENQRFELQPQ